MLADDTARKIAMKHQVQRTIAKLSEKQMTAADYLRLSFSHVDAVKDLAGRLSNHSKYDITKENMADIAKSAIGGWIVANEASKLHEERLIAAIEHEDGSIPRVIYYANEQGYHEQLLLMPRIAGTTKRKGQIVLAVPPEIIIEWGGDPILSNRDGTFSRSTYVQKDNNIFGVGGGVSSVEPIALIYSKNRSYAQLASSTMQFRDIIENNYHGIKLMFASSEDDIAEIEFAVVLLRMKLLFISALTHSLNYVTMRNDAMGLKRPVIIGEEVGIDLGDGYMLRSGLPVIQKASSLRMDMLREGLDKYLPYFILPRIHNVLTGCLSESYVDRKRRVQTGADVTMPLTKYEKELGHVRK